MADEQLTKYIKKGLDKGFRLEYIRDTLLKYNYSPESVEAAIRELKAFQSQEIPYEFKQTPQQSHNKSMVWILSSIVVILVVILVVAVITTKKTYDEGKDIIKIDADQQRELSEKVSKLDLLSSTIDEKQRVIAEKLDQIQKLGGDVEEKDKMLKEQARQLQQVNEDVRQEREHLKVMLLDLLNSMLRRSAPTGEEAQ